MTGTNGVAIVGDADFAWRLAEARVWLDGAGPSSVLEKQDRWQRE